MPLLCISILTYMQILDSSRGAIRRGDLISGRGRSRDRGKSFGGRMTSQAQAASPLPGVRGLVFLGFPLHPAGRPSEERGKHLFEVRTRPLKLCFLTASI